ncbi:MAG TPA: hypothetical protein VGD68_08845 [Streptosporangiaceae bacterium]
MVTPGPIENIAPSGRGMSMTSRVMAMASTASTNVPIRSVV